jgi:hypothetical protein
MSKTKFQKENSDFSDLAHLSGLEKIYPLFFGADFVCESTSLYKSKEYQLLDGEKKIDRLFHFSMQANSTITISVQERFRRPKYREYRDITITEYNHASSKDSELYGIEAMYFVYGYFNPLSGGFGEVIIVNTADLLRAIVSDKIRYTRRMNDKDQSFLCFKIDDIIKQGLYSFYARCLNPSK